MRIGIICFPSFGGSGALATELGKYLAGRGHKVHFISSDMPFRLMGPWRKNIYFHRVEEIEYPLFQTDLYDLTLASKIAEIALQENLEILHAHYSFPHAISVFLAKEIVKSKRKIKSVITLHGTDVTIFGSNSSVADINQIGIKNADCVTAVCRNLAHQAKEIFKIKKVEVIYNFVNMKKNEEDSVELREIFATKKEKLVIHISNFREVKRVQDVLEVFKGINNKIPSKLLLVGDGPEQRMAQKLIAKLKLGDKVHFLGVQNNIARLLTVSDLLLLPSEKEAFNLSALEAFSCGVPVIATNVGGMSEMITNGETGYLSGVGDVNEMIGNALKILSDPKLAKKLSKNCQRAIKEKYSPEVIVPQYEKLYQRLLGH